MRKLFTLLLVVVAGIGTVFAWDYEHVQIGDLYYNLDATNQTAEVTFQLEWNKDNYKGLTDANIPASVTYSDVVYSVTSIGENAFSGCSGLTSMTIPNSVTSIGDYAFSGCSGLTSVTIPNSVTSIGNYAFSGCSGLTSVTIPNSVTSIGEYAFSDCSGLTSLTIPNSVTSIGERAFYNVPNIVYSGSATGSPWGARSINGYVDGYLVYSDEAKTNLLACSSAATGDITIPNSVTSIGNSAFKSCSSLTSITIPNSVTSIGRWAFEYCTGLSSVTIPNSVTSIGQGAFIYCSGLTSVHISDIAAWCAISFGYDANPLYYAHNLYLNGELVTDLVIPNSVTSIGGGAFDGCTGLNSVTIPNSVTSIGGGAFDGCTGLTTVIWNAKNCADFASNNTPFYANYYDEEWDYQIQFDLRPQITSFTFGNEVEHIPANLCSGMSNLTSVTIPNSVTSIGYGAFEGCSGLPVIDNIRYADTYLVEAVDKTLSSYTIKEGTRFIGGSAFSGYTGLTSVTIPNSVTSIGEEAFRNCSGLTSVTIEAETPPTLGGSTVFSNTNNCPIYVPCGTLDAYKTAWSYSSSSSRITHSLSQECIYTISTTSANPEWGTTAGGKSALYLDEVEISATANYGYHFVKWNDNNTSNPRTVSVTEDKTYTATFAKNVYSITKNAEHGTISGNNYAEYLDFVTLTVTPDYGYHFTQWSDGLKDNPRIFQITQDTTFTAEFAYDRVGTCGKDLALVWSYDPANKVLTIGNAGEFTENMQFGAEAPNEMEELVIGNNVTAIGENAFAGISTLKKVTIGESVKTIYNNAFYNCVNLETIFNYRQTPTNAYSTAFDGVDKFACSLYVLPSSIDMYKAAAVWRDFYYTYAIGAEEATVLTNDVKVEPQDNAATVTWPTSENAATYTIEITKDDEVFCTLIFNGNGQLTGIAFAPGKNGNRHAPAAKMTANGLQFTVTGLNSATHYALTLQAKDDQNAVLASYSSEFTTTGTATAIDQIDSSSLQGGDRGRLILHNGQVFILRGDKTYTLQGQEIK